MNQPAGKTSPRQRLLAELQAEAAWQDRAACRGMDPDLFFPVRGDDTRAAKTICEGCPVRLQCLDYALRARETHGIWGGKSERERRHMRRQRREAVA